LCDFRTTQRPRSRSLRFSVAKATVREQHLATTDQDPIWIGREEAIHQLIHQLHETGTVEVYKVIADVPVNRLDELERILIEKISLSWRLNPLSRGFIEHWLPHVQMYDLLEWIDQLFLKSSMMMEGSVVHSIIASSVFRVAEKLAKIADMGPIIHP
jgi:hypothetical protein